MYFLFVFLEILLALAVAVPVALFAPPLTALIVIVLLALAVYFFRPARRLSRLHRREQRRVSRQYRPANASDAITLRPPDRLTPAEVSRLMGVLRAIPPERAEIADLTATLLDLNRRGFLDITASKGSDILSEDSLRVICRRSIDEKQLVPHERAFMKLLKSASGSAYSIQLSAFREYAAHAPRRVLSRVDAFRSAVDHQLMRRKLFARIRTADRKFPFLFGRRITVLTQRGEQAAALWRSYLRNICAHPYLESYQPNTEEQRKTFAAEAIRLLTDAASCGVCARASAALLHEYLFEPSEIWAETLFFSSLTEARTAFSGDASGESYYFLPLHDFEAPLMDLLTYGEVRS